MFRRRLILIRSGTSSSSSSRALILEESFENGIGEIDGIIVSFAAVAVAGVVGAGRGFDETASVGIQRKGRVERFRPFVSVIDILHVHRIRNFHVGIVVHAEVLERPRRRVMMANVDENGDEGQNNDDDDGNGDGETDLSRGPD